MDRRVMLAFGAIALVAACIILYFALRADHSDALADTHADDPVAATDATKASKRTGSAREGAVTDGSGVTILPDGTREYMKDGRLIRDHRKNPYIPHEPAPKREPAPDGRKIAPVVTSDINKVFQPVLRECASKIPVDARGKKPRVDGVMTIAIKDHQASVTETNVAVRDVQGDAAIAEFKKCLTEKSAGLAAQAPGEADVERYQLSLSLALPRSPKP